MMQTDAETIRRSVEMDKELGNTIQGMADKKTFGSFSKMCYLLLQQAVKEINRKKKIATKEDHT